MGVYLKIPSNGVPTGRINYESDFIVKIILNKKVGDRDFKIDFFTHPNKMVRFSRYNGVMSSNLKASNNGGGTCNFSQARTNSWQIASRSNIYNKN